MLMVSGEPVAENESYKEFDAMFDTKKVAEMIKKARVEKNMTQMNLADEMGVSYQAVSNWERGNSMPDISKIPELCKVLDISFEELVGEESKAASTAKKMIEDEDATVTLDELVEVAPIIKPKQVEKVAERNINSDERVKVSDLVGVAPFLGAKELDALVDRVDVEDVGELVGLAPFLKRSTLDKFVDRCLGQGNVDPNELVGLAPFLANNTIQKIVDYDSLKWNGGALTAFAPFMKRGMISGILRRGFVSWSDEKEDDATDSDEGTDDEADLLERLDEEDVAVLANEAYDAGKPVEKYFDYMNEKDVKKLAMKILRDRH